MGITPKQARLLRLILEEGLSKHQAAQRLNISDRAVYRMLQAITRKGEPLGLQKIPLKTPGYGSLPFKKVAPLEKHPPEHISKSPVETEVRPHIIRLHAQRFRVRLFHSSGKHPEGSSFDIDGEKVRVYRRALVVWSNRSFYGSSADAAYAESWAFWRLFFLRLASREGFLIYKAGGADIRQICAHYAEVDNEIAEECRRRAEFLQIRDNGKLWAVTDLSLGRPELEAVDPAKAREDMQRALQPFLNDLRAHPDIKLSELSQGFLKLSEGFAALCHLMPPQEASEDHPEPAKKPPWYIG